MSVSTKISLRRSRGLYKNSKRTICTAIAFLTDLFGTAVSLLTDCFVLEYPYWLNFFVLQYPYWLNIFVLEWNTLTDPTFCTGISLPTDYFFCNTLSGWTFLLQNILTDSTFCTGIYLPTDNFDCKLSLLAHTFCTQISVRKWQSVRGRTLLGSGFTQSVIVLKCIAVN